MFEANGDTHFVTSAVVGFVPLFREQEPIRIFLENLRFYQDRGDYTLLAWVLMPEHFHIVVKRSVEHPISRIVGNLKRMTSRQITESLRDTDKAQLLERLAVASSKEPTRDSKVWQYRFDSFVVTKEETLVQKIEYIHFNPVRRGLARMAEEWPYSSARNYAGIGNGLVDVDVEWCCLGYEKLPSGKGS